MPNFKGKKGYAPKFLEIRINKNLTARGADATALSAAKKRIFWQAGLAGITIILTIVIAFAMTSAWYTNIVQTSGLVFEAEAWGFDGTIQVNEEPIVAGPGDDGVIQFEVTNASESIVDVGVNISKARMIEAMQQRLYFYVDTQLERNGETMDRIYLNNQEGYDYTLFSNGKLSLAEDVYNDAQLKWQWVYDVLGYYVYGTEITSTRIVETGETGENGEPITTEEEVKTVHVTEYLRPIEYDYDEATTTFQTDEMNNQIMVLQTVDGETSVDDFLVELSQTDGYKGSIDPAKKLESGFYPVDVKEDEYGNLHGVYAYLCSYGEIELATQWDTEMGQKAAEAEAGDKEKDSYVVQLLVSAQKNKNYAVNVTTLAGLNKAMEMDAADVIQLSRDITVPANESLVIASGKKIMLDLNEHKIISENSDTAIKVEEGGHLTMINGTVDGTAVKTANGIYAVGSEVLLNNIDVVGCSVGLRIADDGGEKAMDSKVRLVDCKVEAKDYGLVVKGNGSKSQQTTQLILEHCDIISDSVGISGNGTKSQSGTDIQVIDSTITGTEGKITTGIFHPQEGSKLTVYQSVVNAGTGLAIKGGDVSVINSTINGVGPYGAPGFYGSGCADTGDGIYIETNYECDILLEISDNSIITSANSSSLQVHEPDASNVTVRIYSGVFDEPQPEKYIAEGSEQNGTTVMEKS